MFLRSATRKLVFSVTTKFQIFGWNTDSYCSRYIRENLWITKEEKVKKETWCACVRTHTGLYTRYCTYINYIICSLCWSKWGSQNSYYLSVAQISFWSLWPARTTGYHPCDTTNVSLGDGIYFMSALMHVLKKTVLRILF